MTWRVILGTLSLVVTMVVLGYVAVTEQDRMVSFTKAYEARQVEVGAALFESSCRACHGDQGQGVPGKGPTLNSADLFDGTRLAEAGWAGTTDNFIRTAIAGGRPRPSAKYSDFPERMPTWGEDYGGPLRSDQVNALVAFILNWGKAYEPGAQPAVVIVGVGTDITVELPAGDPATGKDLAKAQGCVACHIDTPTGPAWLAGADPNAEGVATRAAHLFSDAGYTGKAASAEQYLFESIVQPNAYLVSGDAYKAASGKSLMPEIYGGKLDKQMVADILAYLMTIK